MNIEEIRAELASLTADMVAKGIKTPRLDMLVSETRFQVIMWCDTASKQFDGDYVRTLIAATPADAIAKASAYIAALPDPATEGERRFTRALADAVDIATEYALPDDLVAPVKTAIAQVNDLLALPGAA